MPPLHAAVAPHLQSKLTNYNTIDISPIFIGRNMEKLNSFRFFAANKIVLKPLDFSSVQKMLKNDYAFDPDVLTSLMPKKMIDRYFPGNMIPVANLSEAALLTFISRGGQIENMPKEVFDFTKKKCKKNSLIGLLATEGTIKTGVYSKFFNKNFNLIHPNKEIQKNSVNKAIKLVKMGKVKSANKIIKPAIDFLIKQKCKKIILGCTELPIAIFAFKSFKTIKSSKIFLDPNLILANAAMKKYRK